MDIPAEQINISAFTGEGFDPDAAIVPEIPGVAPAATVGEYKAYFAAKEKWEKSKGKVNEDAG